MHNVHGSLARSRPADRGSGGGPVPVEPAWSDEESEAAFQSLGDRVIDATRVWGRSRRRQRLQRDLYTVDGVQLSLGQVDALETVAAGSIRMHELADNLGIDPSTATRVVTPLVRLGLVERRVDESNRRYVTLTATALGRAAAQRIMQERRQLMREVLAPMSPERRFLLADLLEEYLALMDRVEHTAPGGAAGENES
jgi:DNA-binding MarR family transcriptional regulator